MWPSCLLTIGLGNLFAAAGARASEPLSPPATRTSDTYEQLTIRGRFVWLAEAMAKRFGAQAVPEAVERVMAIEAPDGQLVPLLEDVRGRAFRADPALRTFDLELEVRRYRGAPAVQLIRLYSLEKGVRYELDYWCEICSIVMFERKLCECCQGTIELRKRKVPGP